MPDGDKPHLLERYPVFTAERLALARFQQEQDYLLAKLRQHNRMLHGWGVVDGLEVSLQASRSGDEVWVEPGYALDCAGNEIRVAKAVSLSLPPREGEGVLYLCLEYLEERVAGEISDEVDEERLVSIREGFEVSLNLEDPQGRHPADQPPLFGCGTQHALTLARLTFARIRWRVDRHFSPKYLNQQR